MGIVNRRYQNNGKIFPKEEIIFFWEKFQAKIQVAEKLTEFGISGGFDDNGNFFHGTMPDPASKALMPGMEKKL